jgi:hypothetical protein
MAYSSELLTPDGSPTYIRRYQNEKILVTANFTSKNLEHKVNETNVTLLNGNGFTASIDKTSLIMLPAFNIAYLDVY